MPSLFRRGPLPLLRELERTESSLLRDYFAQDPIGCAYLEDRLDAAGHAGRTQHNARFYGLFPHAGDAQTLLGVVFAGVNLMPHGLWASVPGAASVLVNRLYDERAHQPSSIYGQASSVMAIWQEFSRHGIRAHEIRAHQPLLALTRDRFAETGAYWEDGLPPLSVSDLADYPQLLEASIAMFTEEVGYSPVEETVLKGRTILPNAEAYEARVRQLIAEERSYSRIEHGRVVFKAEFAALTPQTGAVQGVWLAPEHRGQGLSAGYMRALCAAGLERTESISLYANGYNYPALAAYAKAGFEQVGTFATVML